MTGIYNKKKGLTRTLPTHPRCFVPPENSQVKGYPFEVIIPSGLKVSGVILSDQVKSLNWKIRDAEHFDKIPETVILEFFKKLGTLLRFDS